MIFESFPCYPHHHCHPFWINFFHLSLTSLTPIIALCFYYWSGRWPDAKIVSHIFQLGYFLHVQVMIIITGAHKAFALYKAVEEGVSHMWTVSAFQQHPRTIFVCDEDATLELRVKTVKYFKGLMGVHNQLVKEMDQLSDTSWLCLKSYMYTKYEL